MIDESTAGAGSTPYAGDVAAPGTLTEAQHQEIPHRAESPAPPAPDTEAAAGAQGPDDAAPAAEAGPTAVAAATSDYGPEPQTFADMGLSEEVHRALTEMGFQNPMPVQRAVFRPMMAGRDLLVQSRTGSGKTAAFGIPFAQKLIDTSIDCAGGHVQAIVLGPTRELALQVANECGRIAQNRGIQVVPVYGGAPMGRQVEQLKAGGQVVSGTPGRVLDHIRRGTLHLSAVRILVLDEADEMLSMGFYEDIVEIIKRCPEDRQTLLFSATMPEDVERLSRRHMRDPLKLCLSLDFVGAQEITHGYYMVSGVGRPRDLMRVLEIERPDSAVIFCNTREETALVAEYLRGQGLDAENISSDLAQSDRERVMGLMKQKRLKYLVATDIAARGIDISDLSHVINFTLPESAEVYIHRTGRTGRAGKSGVAISLVGPRELGNFYFLKLTYKIKPEERSLPSEEEMQTLREGQQLDRLTRELRREPGQSWRALLKRVQSSDDGERILSALLERYLSGELRHNERPERQERPERHDRPERPERHDRHHERPERGERLEGRPAREAREDRPEGERPRREDRPEGERPRREDRPEGDRPRRERLEGDRHGPRREGRSSRDGRGERDGRGRRDRDRRGRDEEFAESPSRRRERLEREGRTAQAGTPRPENEAGEATEAQPIAEGVTLVEGQAAPVPMDGDAAPAEARATPSQAPAPAGDDAAEGEVEAAEGEAAEGDNSEEARRKRRRRGGRSRRRGEGGEGAAGNAGNASNGGNAGAAASSDSSRSVSMPGPNDVIEVEDGREFWEAWVDSRSGTGSSAIEAPEGAEAAEGEGDAEGEGEGGADRGRRRRRRRNGESKLQIEEGQQRLYLNLGRRDGLDEAAVVTLLTERGLPTFSSELHSTHCYLAVPDEQVDGVMGALNGQTHGERTVLCERARK